MQLRIIYYSAIFRSQFFFIITCLQIFCEIDAIVSHFDDIGLFLSGLAIPTWRSEHHWYHSLVFFFADCPRPLEYYVSCKFSFEAGNETWQPRQRSNTAARCRVALNRECSHMTTAIQLHLKAALQIEANIF